MNLRLAALAAGVAALWIAIASPVAYLDHHLLTWHMAQHLVLMMVAAPLMLFAWGSTAAFDRSLPAAFCWLAGSLTVILWHMPAVFALALQSHYWHAVEQMSFVLSGLLFWQPVIRPSMKGINSGWSIPIYLFLATLPCDALSAYLAFCGRVVYPSYLHGNNPVGMSPLDDQELAGALMWVTVTFAYLIPALALSARLLSGEQPASPQIEAA